jgi:hypothetical protein
MELREEQRSLLEQYLDDYAPLVRDRRTAATFRGTVAGIIGAEGLVCARIAAFSPSVGGAESVC